MFAHHEKVRASVKMFALHEKEIITSVQLQLAFYAESNFSSNPHFRNFYNIHVYTSTNCITLNRKNGLLETRKSLEKTNSQFCLFTCSVHSNKSGGGGGGGGGGKKGI